MRIAKSWKRAFLIMLSMLCLAGCAPAQNPAETTVSVPGAESSAGPVTEAPVTTAAEVQPVLPDVVEIPPLPACWEASELFTATVNGEAVPVYRCHAEYDVCAFSFRGEVTLEIDAGQTVKSVSVSPLAKEIPAEKSGRTVTITLTEPQYLIVKINALRELVIAADPAETDAPPSEGAGIWNVAALGADPQGSSSATAVIQSAVDEASAAGGGVVYVPAGVYSIGNVELKSNVHLYLAPGAVLRADCEDEFLRRSPYAIGDVTYSVTYMVTTQPNSKNVRVSGRGALDCRGTHYREAKSWVVFAFVPNHTDGLVLDGVTIRDTGLWGTVIAYCRDVTITNTKHLNKPSTLGQNDAIDIVGSQNVTVRRTIAFSRDDPYSIKTYVTHNLFEGVGRAAEHILFEDCFCWTRCAAFKFGWGVEMGMRDITFRNCFVYACNLGLAVTHYGGSAAISDVTYENIDIENFLLDGSVWLLASVGTSKPGGNRKDWGSIKNLTVKNVNVRAAWKGQCLLGGHDKSHLLDGVSISGITIRGRACATLAEMGVTKNEFAHNITVDGVSVD